MSVQNSQSKLIAIVAALGDMEVRQLRKLLQSTYFTRRLHIRDLFNVLVKLIKKHGFSIDREVVYHQTFTDSAYDDARLRKAMTDLLQLINESLLINARRADTIQSQLTLLGIYRDRKLKKAYASALIKTKAFLDRHPKRNSAYYQQLLSYTFYKSNQFDGTEVSNHEIFKEIAELEDLVYLSRKLRSACVQLSRQLIHRHQSDFGLLTTVLEKIEQEKYLTVPAIAIYYYCYKFLTVPGEPSYFQRYKKTLDDHSQLFTSEDLSDSYRSAINYCIRKNNEGDHSYLQELWELYKKGLEQGILLVNHQLPSFTFDNALTVGLRLKAYDWAAEFISDASQYLNPAVREQSVLFNSGKLAYELKDYDRALLHLQQADFKEVRINVIGKILLIKIYYELDSFLTLQSHLDSFQQFIRRKGISEYHRNNVLNTIRFVKKLLSLPAYDKTERAKLREQIQNEQILSEREWLLDRV